MDGRSEGGAVMGRFDGMTKVPAVPAARLLAEANLQLSRPVDAPASAPLPVVMAELAAREAVADQLMLMALALPPRERVWWACLAARDMVGPDPVPRRPPLAAAEAWVFKPTDEARAAAKATLDHAPVGDDTTHCALAVAFCDGTLGPGEMARHPAPAGASALAAFAMNATALGAHDGDVAAYAVRLVDRAVNIARGGNGRLAPQDQKDASAG